MNTDDLLNILLGKFELLSEWENMLNNDFPRETVPYNSVKIDTVFVESDSIKYIFPKRIIFSKELVTYEHQINVTQNVFIDRTAWSICRSTIIYPLGFYKRKEKFSGAIGSILKDCIELHNVFDKYVYHSNKLLQYNDGLLYALDSTLGWSSYMFVITDKELKQFKSEGTINFPKEVTHMLHRFGINYSPSKIFENITFVLFPLYFAKILHERVRKKKDKEVLEIVVQQDMVTLWRRGENELEIEYKIKDTQNEIVHQGKEKLIGEGEFLFHEISPEKSVEIKWARLNLLLNNCVIDTSEGYFVRSVSIDMKIKDK